MKFWKKQHLDQSKVKAEKVSLGELTEILDHGSEEDFINFLKKAGRPVTQERLNDFRRLRSEKRGLLR